MYEPVIPVGNAVLSSAVVPIHLKVRCFMHAEIIFFFSAFYRLPVGSDQSGHLRLTSLIKMFQPTELSLTHF